MAKIIHITNGVGSGELVEGTYAVTSSTLGYDNAQITPAEVTIDAETAEYVFTIAATWSFTLHVSDDGTDVGVPIVGAKFIRCDAEGTTYGEEITSDEDGNATFANTPYSEEENTPHIYYKQTASDGSHNFDSELKNIQIHTETHTEEITNEAAAERHFKLTDAHYENLPIADGEINLE